MMKQLFRTMLILATLALLPLNAFSADYKWDMTSGYAPTSQHGRSQAVFEKLVEEKTGGKIEITNHYGASLGYKGVGIFDAVTDGVVPIGLSFVGVLRGVDPIFLLSSLPFVTETYEDAMHLWEVSRPYYEKTLKENNQVLLYVVPNPPSGIWSKKPIKTKADLENLKIRTYDPNGTITFKNIGAAPIQLTWADLIPQLGTGGIDAVLTSAESGRSSKFWEFLDYFNEVGYCISLIMVHMNADLYNGLPDDLKQKVMEAAEEASVIGWKESAERIEQVNYKVMREHDTKIVSGMPKELLNQLSVAGQDAVKKWKDKMGPDGDKILAEYEKLRGN
jgi:TRAP-type C4-dicarboxylate transport system substrate-binding protein